MSQPFNTPYSSDSGNKVDVNLASYINETSFTWSKLITHSSSTGRKTITEEQFNNLKILATKLEIIKVNSGIDFSITSGLRNKKAQDSPSDHFIGAAADLFISDHKKRKDLWEEIYSKGNYTWKQIIWEDQKTTANNPGSVGNYPDYPGIIHFAYLEGKNNKVVSYSTENGRTAPTVPYPPSSNISASDKTTGSSEGTTSNTTGQQSTGDDTQLDKANKLVGSYAETLKSADTSLKDLQLGQVDRTWGMGYEDETISGDIRRNDWISLKQFLLYLATRFVPQSVYPFIELIPSASLSDNDYDRDGDVIIDKNGDIVIGDSNKKQKTISGTNDPQPSSAFKTQSEAGINATNSAAKSADLFSIDPFKESYEGKDENNNWVLSSSGEEVEERRGVGVRVYSQLVLNPTPGSYTPSMPGAIGFTELEIQAGAQCENGLAVIKMKLVDVQGNKFTDLSSPWSFIYDSRPGSVGGDFYFRYGWQIRVPDPNDKEDLASYNFWHHEGWLLFNEDIKNTIVGQVSSAKPFITLAQSINGEPSTERDESKFYSLFDEGVTFTPKNGTVTVNRENLSLNNYVVLALLNPELDASPEGALTATLSFRTTGSLAAGVPLLLANNCRKIMKKRKGGIISLGDLCILIQTDFATWEYSHIKDANLKAVQSNYIQPYLSKLAYSKKTDRDFTNFVSVIGLEEGFSIGMANPDDIYLKISTESYSLICNEDPSNNNGELLIGWFRQILEDNGMELGSVATGSGAGINSAWVISVGADFNKDMYIPKKRTQSSSKYEDLITLLEEEKDIFSFRFQGTLVESIKVEKTEANNSLKIASDYAVADFLATMSSETEDSNKLRQNSSSVADRRRNLNILFAQLQSVKVTSLCHPWIGPGKDFYIKGMGFWDGQYKALKTTHKLDSFGGRFLSEIIGARMIVPSKKEEKQKALNLASANGQDQTTTSVESRFETPVGSTFTPMKPSEQPKESNSSSFTTVTADLNQKFEDAFNPNYYSNGLSKVSLLDDEIFSIAKNFYTLATGGTISGLSSEQYVLKIYQSQLKTITNMSYLVYTYNWFFSDRNKKGGLKQDILTSKWSGISLSSDGINSLRRTIMNNTSLERTDKNIPVVSVVRTKKDIIQKYTDAFDSTYYKTSSPSISLAQAKVLANTLESLLQSSSKTPGGSLKEQNDLLKFLISIKYIADLSMISSVIQSSLSPYKGEEDSGYRLRDYLEGNSKPFKYSVDFSNLYSEKNLLQTIYSKPAERTDTGKLTIPSTNKSNLTPQVIL